MAEYDRGRAGESSARSGSPPLQRGELTSFDAQELSGWITGDDGRLYRFSAANVIGEEEIAAGQAVTFMDIGENAYQVRRCSSTSDPDTDAPVAGAVPPPEFVHPAPTSAPVPVPQRVPVENLHVSHRAASGWTEPAPRARRRRRGNKLFAKVLIAVALIGGLAYLYLQRELPSEVSSVKTTIAAEPVGADVPPFQTAAKSGSVAPRNTTPPSVEKADAISRAQAAPGSGSPPDARPAKPAAAARPELELSERISRPDVTAKSPAPKAAPPPISAWWPAPRLGSLNLMYAGHLAGDHAIVLMFDSGFTDTGDLGRHIYVTGSNGAPVIGQWRVGSNNTMLLLDIPPGLYKVTIGPELADSAGKSLGLRLNGSVLVR